MFADGAFLYVSGSNLESVESQLNSAMNEVYKIQDTRYFIWSLQTSYIEIRFPLALH